MSTDSIRCIYCATTVGGNDAFCGNCGQALQPGALMRQPNRHYAHYIKGTRDHTSFLNDIQISRQLSALIQEWPTLDLDLANAPEGFTIYKNLRVGEVVSHFDSNQQAQLSGTISGVMNHDFWLHGWAGFGRVGRFGVGLAQLGLSGQSQVDLSLAGTMSGTIRADLFNDGMVAILEDTNTYDTYRITCPSEAGCASIINDLLDSLWQFGNSSYTGQILGQYNLSQFTCNVSYVSDRLRAILRMPEAARPTITAAGVEVGVHNMLVGALQISGDERTYQLFPLILLKELVQATDCSPLANAEHVPTGVTLTRVLQKNGGGGRYGVFVDGIRVASLAGGETTDCPLPPGRHYILAAWSTFKSEPFEFEILPGQQLYLVCGEASGPLGFGRLVIRTDPDEHPFLKD